MATNVTYSQDRDGQVVTTTNGFYGLDAEINPDELATFPKQVQATGQHHQHHSHLVSHRTPVRDGRNITRTDHYPSRGGFM